MDRRFALQAALAVVLTAGLATAGAVLPVGRAQAAASLRLSSGTIPAGGNVTVTGYGFAPNDLVTVSSRIVVAGRASTAQANTTSDSSGTFAARLTFPGATQQGTYTVTARDFAGHSASTTITVLPVATIRVGAQPGTTYVIPNHRVWVNATGFDPNELVSFHASFPLYNGNTTTVQPTRRANLNGNVYGLVLTIPGDAAAGSVTLTATGETSKRSGSVTLRVVYRPHITVSPTTARPGTSVTVRGTDFVPGSTIQASINVTYSNGVPATLARTVVANASGEFSTPIYLPPNVRVGGYTVSARDVSRGFRATAPLTVSVKPTIRLSPSTLYPGQTVKISGVNFGTGSTVHIAADVRTASGTQHLTTQTVAGSGGAYLAYLHIPSTAQSGNVTVTARTVNGSAQATLHVQQRPTPMPTAVPPTATPQPTATSTPHHVPALGFRYVSIWYHWMRQGTREHIVAQSTISTKQGIWVHVWYPNGQHQVWYQNTNDFGYWDKWFTVPYNSATSTNDQALVTFRLWHGKDNVKDFAHFGIVR